MQKRVLILTAVFVWMLSWSVNAGVRYDIADFESAGPKGDVGVVSVGDATFFKLGLSPDLKLGGLELGLGLNLYVPITDGADYPSDLSFLSLRHIGYTHKDLFGIKGGRLTGVNLGHGLLMDNFDTGSGGSAEMSMDKAGVLAFARLGSLKIHTLATAQALYGVRTTLRLPESLVLGMPVEVGASYITDQEGVGDSSDSTSVTRVKQDGYSADVSLPIGGKLFTPYVEYANLVDQGTGLSAGFYGKLGSKFDYRAAYRVLEKGFAPGYFNQAYYAQSFDFETDALKEDVAGILAQVNADLMGVAKAGAMYENYSGTQLLTWALGWKRIQNVAGVVNYTQTFQEEVNPVADATLIYYTHKPFDVIINVKRVYQDDGSFTESYNSGFRLNLDRLVPSIF